MKKKESYAKTIRVNIPVSPAHESAFFKLISKKIKLEIPLTDGTHIVTTSPEVIGYWRNMAEHEIHAQVTVWYEFDSRNKLITLCSNDFVSDKSMYLATYLNGTSRECVQHTYNDERNPCGTNSKWNYCTPSTPELKGLFYNLIRQANTILIEEAKKNRLNVIELSSPLPLAKEDFEKLHLVYHQGEFLELYDPGKKYSSDHDIVNILSVYKGTITFSPSQHFANVIKSTKDPKVPGYPVWIRLWDDKCNIGMKAAKCASYKLNGFPCTNHLVGGHVILGNVAKPMPPGAPKKAGQPGVYIIPICKKHNGNNKVFMEPLVYQKAVVLAKYFQK